MIEIDGPIVVVARGGGRGGNWGNLPPTVSNLPSPPHPGYLRYMWWLVVSNCSQTP